MPNKTIFDKLQKKRERIPRSTLELLRMDDPSARMASRLAERWVQLDAEVVDSDVDINDMAARLAKRWVGQSSVTP